MGIEENKAEILEKNLASKSEVITIISTEHLRYFDRIIKVYGNSVRMTEPLGNLVC